MRVQRGMEGTIAKRFEDDGYDKKTPPYVR
jgi:hypothetical protein